jgi:hypothetical protein
MRIRTRHAGNHASRHGTSAHRRNTPDGSPWTIVPLPGPPLGPGVVVASLEEVLAALAAVPPDLDWGAVSGHILPILPRVRRHPPGFPAPLHVVVPPGLSIGFGLDVGPAFVTVSREMLQAWALTPADLLANALENLQRYAARISPADVVRMTTAGTRVSLLQSEGGTGSALFLLPEQLERLFGSSPQLLLSPARDLVIALPLDVDRGLACDLFDHFASRDPDCLALVPLLLRDGRVSLDDASPGPTGRTHPGRGRVN